MAGRSFQELFVRSPVRLRGFGLRSMEESTAAAFIGGTELALPSFSGSLGLCRPLEHLLGGRDGDSWWRCLLESECRTAQEFRRSWRALFEEGEQCCNFLGKEMGGHLSLGPAGWDKLEPGFSSRHTLTDQREELREAVVSEALTRHPDQTARPVTLYPQLDKLSTAWKLSLPGPLNGMSSKVFQEVMSAHLCLPSLATREVVGHMVRDSRGNLHEVGRFGDEVMCATLPGDSWRWRHDGLKTCLTSLCEEAKIPVEVEVFGLFRHLIPAEESGAGGQLHQFRQRNGLCPDLRLRVPTSEGVRDQLGEIKTMAAGITRYPLGDRRKQVDRRAGELPGEYRRPLAKLDIKHHDTLPGETGPLVRLLQSFGELQCLVAGAWGEGLVHLHSLIQTCVDSRISHLVRMTGQQSMEGKRSVLVSQYRRLVSTCVVRAQAQCLLSRVSAISEAAKGAADRRRVTQREEMRFQEEREAQWMAGLYGPGWVRRGRWSED